MDRKALIAIALSFVVLFGSNFLFQKLGWIPSPAQQRAVNEVRADSASRPSPAPGAATLGATLPAAVIPGAAPRSSGTWATPEGADSVLTIDQPLYTARIRARGARL